VALPPHPKVRYNRNVIYTYVSDILIAVNPFKSLPIYGPETMIKVWQYDRKPSGMSFSTPPPRFQQTLVALSPL
jgi:hypothetical protein